MLNIKLGWVFILKIYSENCSFKNTENSPPNGQLHINLKIKNSISSDAEKIEMKKQQKDAEQKTLLREVLQKC